MAIKYCSYTSGNDTSGDGSYGSPYKTITKASTGLTGGDEVRVAKSPDDTALTGTITFTAGSATITGSGTLFTSELANGDFVKGADGDYYEVIARASDTSATLYKIYPSSTQAGVSSYKMGITSTGGATATTTQVQVVSASGASVSSRLKISGGWDLATQTQTGVTNFRQLHSTFTARYGYGLYATGKSYVEIEKLGFFRYNTGMYWVSGSYNKYNYVTLSSNLLGFDSNGSIDEFDNMICSSNNTTGMECRTSNSSFGTIRANANGNYGLYLTNRSNVDIANITCKYNNNHGLYINDMCVLVDIKVAVLSNNVQYGLYLYGRTTHVTIANLTADNNTINAFYFDDAHAIVVHYFSGTGNIELSKSTAVSVSEKPILSFQRYNADGVQKNYFYGGETYSNTAEARSGKCLHYDPSSATLYMSHSFYFKATSATALTLSAYLKKKNSFNGDVQADVFFLGTSLFGWTAWTPTNDDTYEQKSFSVTSGMVTDDGILELRVKVRGTVGDVYLDDLGAV